MLSLKNINKKVVNKGTNLSCQKEKSINEIYIIYKL